jgi:hypothetical protein
MTDKCSPLLMTVLSPTPVVGMAWVETANSFMDLFIKFCSLVAGACIAYYWANKAYHIWKSKN